ncbi:MAG: phosphoglycerate dehydrogenase [Bdellovibrionales bacterium]|nr:phosphoglycerate dehydrogenase [Bdellovibrionales bacterium]
MTKKKILLLENIHPGAKNRLEANGFQVQLETISFADDELVAKAKGFQAIGIRSKTQITKSVLAQLPDIEAVGCFCIGTDQVDLDFANEIGLPVFNAPYSNTRSVAELVLCEMIALSRHLADRTMQMHKGQWQKSADGANEVRGKTLGIIGYGHIGSQLSVIAESLGVHVIYYDVVKKLPLGNARVCETLHECLAQSDFISLHVPDTSLTQGMMGESEIKCMKAGSYLINASRGKVVDIPALARALKSKHLSGAAIDVFPVEPASNKEPFISEIQELENVILTPHIGGSTIEAQEAIGQEVAESFTRYFYSGATTGAVNFPQVDVAMPRDYPRILNIHRNVPGVLGEVNGIISALKGNIVAQHLSTDARLGYLAIDLGVSDPQEVAKRISALPTSIRTRVVSERK